MAQSLAATPQKPSILTTPLWQCPSRPWPLSRDVETNAKHHLPRQEAVACSCQEMLLRVQKDAECRICLTPSSLPVCPGVRGPALPNESPTYLLSLVSGHSSWPTPRRVTLSAPSLGFFMSLCLCMLCFLRNPIPPQSQTDFYLSFTT